MKRYNQTFYPISGQSSISISHLWFSNVSRGYWNGLFRNSHQRCSIKVFLSNFSKFTGKHLCQGLFFNKVAGLSLQLYLKRASGTGIFLWILRKFYKHLFHLWSTASSYWSEMGSANHQLHQFKDITLSYLHILQWQHQHQ